MNTSEKTLDLIEPIAISKRVAVKILGNSRTLFERGIRTGKIRPVIRGSKGRASLYDCNEVCGFWNSLKSDRGFTLVELLGVVAIIAILATVAVVSIKGVFQSSQDAAVNANLSKISHAWSQARTIGVDWRNWGYGEEGPSEWDAPQMVWALHQQIQDPETGQLWGPFLPGIENPVVLTQLQDAGYPQTEWTGNVSRTPTGIIIGGYLKPSDPDLQWSWFNLVRTSEGFVYRGYGPNGEVIIK